MSDNRECAESNKETYAERILDDQTFIQQVISIMFGPGERGINILSAFWLSRKKEDPSKTRPMEIIYQSEDECHRIPRRTLLLKGEAFYSLIDHTTEDWLK